MSTKPGKPQKKVYAAPAIVTYTARGILEQLGPAAAVYGPPR